MMLPEMTTSQARITEMLLRGVADEALPLKVVAERAEVSESMVVKRAKRLDFPGYRELRTALEAYKSHPTVHMHKEVFREGSVTTIIQKVFRTSTQALEETLAILDIRAFERAAEVIYKARQLDFYGLGGSAQIARDVAHNFLRIGVRTSIFDDTHMMAMSASLLKVGDVVVAFSHTGRTTAILDAVQIARKNGATIIGVSNYETSPLTERSDILLCSNAQGSLLASENAAARIAQLNIMNAIFIAVAQRGYDAAKGNLARTMASVHAKR